MKKVIILLFIVFFASKSVYSQENKTISIIKKIQKEQNDSLKSQYIFDLCVIYQSADIAKYKYYAQLLKTRAQKKKI